MGATNRGAAYLRSNVNPTEWYVGCLPRRSKRRSEV
jgi:hypothetical protein